MKAYCSLALLFLCMFVLPVQAKDVADTPSSESNDSPLVSDLSVEQFSEVVKAIVQQTLQECAVKGDMEGKAKLNLLKRDLRLSQHLKLLSWLTMWI